MRVDNSTGKGTSGIDKFSSQVHRVHMELGGKLLNSLRIETQFFERLQSVNVVDGAAHTQKDDVESNGGSLENVAKIFVLFLCGVQLVLRSGVLTVLDLDVVRHSRWMSRRVLLRPLGRCLIGSKIMRHANLCLSVISHVPYLLVLAPRKDVQGTVYL